MSSSPKRRVRSRVAGDDTVEGRRSGLTAEAGVALLGRGAVARRALPALRISGHAGDRDALRGREVHRALVRGVRLVAGEVRLFRRGHVAEIRLLGSQIRLLL